ncbi:hypothetical protein [Alistipes sp.]|uniref:hypothetical protein n=1 Tax=Alistipes sp. TaxID=1872444 RepID=UPI003AF1389A
MKKINFEKIEIFTDVSKTKTFTGDGREEFANLLYTGCNGIAAHALAFKIYESRGAIEISEAEETLIMGVAEQRCTPAFIDGIKKQLNEEA